MTPVPTHIQVAPGDGATVTIRPTDDGRWFQMLHWYIASGAAARLYRAHKAAPLLVQTLCHLRDRSSGLAVAPIEILRPLLGVKDSTIYEAKTALLRSPDGLALETPPQGWVFHLFPGRQFAGRHSSDIPDSGNADRIPGTRNLPLTLPLCAERPERRAAAASPKSPGARAARDAEPRRRRCRRC